MIALVSPVRNNASGSVTATPGWCCWLARPGGPNRVAGREAIREYLAHVVSSPFTHQEFTDLTIYETDDPQFAIAEYDAHGVLDTTGEPYVFRYLQLLRAENGPITLLRDYWNPLAMASALDGQSEPAA